MTQKIQKKIQGAEATVKISEQVTKNRKKKNYRHTNIDEKIRTERTQKEINKTQKARKHGINTPKILEQKETQFKMEKIEGKPLKNEIETQPKLIKKLAEQVAILHSEDIIHGDLTTSNAIYTGKEIYLIDFGLAQHSNRVEDKAVDLHLLKQILETSHATQENLWQLFEEKYREKGDGQVINKLPSIEERARYK